MFPILIFLLLVFTSWEIIVGITALNDCLGPKVLNGLATTIGVPSDLKDVIAKWSAAILDAAYGDSDLNFKFSVKTFILELIVFPYTSLEEI